MKYICYKCADDGSYYTNRELTKTSPNRSDAFEFSEEEKILLEKNIAFDKTGKPNYVMIEKY